MLQSSEFSCPLPLLLFEIIAKERFLSKEVFCNSCDMQELRYQIAKGYGDKLFGNSGIYEIDRVLSIYFANSINIESNFISYDQYQKKS